MINRLHEIMSNDQSKGITFAMINDTQNTVTREI